MRKKDKEQLLKHFKDTTSKVFNDRATATKMHDCLNELGIAHSFGEYYTNEDGKAKYKLGIVINDTDKLTKLQKQ